MSDPTLIPTTNRQIAIDQGKVGTGKIFSGILAGFISSYLMNQLSLHGINFEADIIPGVRISSEVVKSTLDGVLIGFFVGCTPSHFVAFVKDTIIFIKQSWLTWQQAWKNG